MNEWMNVEKSHKSAWYVQCFCVFFQAWENFIKVDIAAEYSCHWGLSLRGNPLRLYRAKHLPVMMFIGCMVQEIWSHNVYVQNYETWLVSWACSSKSNVDVTVLQHILINANLCCLSWYKLYVHKLHRSADMVTKLSMHPEPLNILLQGLTTPNVMETSGDTRTVTPKSQNMVDFTGSQLHI